MFENIADFAVVISDSFFLDPPFPPPEEIEDAGILGNYGVAYGVMDHILRGITYQNTDSPYAYLSGPMRGYPEFNFPAFDSVRDHLAEKGYTVISPADIDRAAGDATSAQAIDFIYRDFFSLTLVHERQGSIVLLDGWAKSTGAAAELFLARWMGLTVREQDGSIKRKLHSDEYADLIDAVDAYLAEQKGS